MPRMACTSRMDGRRCLRMIRISAVAAVPLSPPAPYTRYTTCRSSTITMGLATAVPRFRAPDVEEPDDERQDRPAHGIQPEVGMAHEGRAVRAVVEVPGRFVVVEGAQAVVVRRGARDAQPLRLEQRGPDQRDVDGGRIDLEDIGELVVLGEAVQRLDAEHDTRGVHPRP